jgi:hypothetical protein
VIVLLWCVVIWWLVLPALLLTGGFFGGLASLTTSISMMILYIVIVSPFLPVGHLMTKNPASIFMLWLVELCMIFRAATGERMKLEFYSRSTMASHFGLKFLDLTRFWERVDVESIPIMVILFRHRPETYARSPYDVRKYIVSKAVWDLYMRKDRFPADLVFPAQIVWPVGRFLEMRVRKDMTGSAHVARSGDDGDFVVMNEATWIQLEMAIIDLGGVS